MLRKGVFFCESFIPRADAFTKTGKASKVLGNGIVESGLKHLDNVADGIKKLVKKADDAIDLEKHLPKKLLKEEAEAFAKKADKVADDVVEDAAKAIRSGSTTADIYSFGNKSAPRGARPQQDFNVENFDSIVGPETGPLPKGASNVLDVNSAPLSGHYHMLPAGTQMPDGLDIIADGIDVIPNSPHGVGHHTIFPTRAMTVNEFNELYKSLPWQYGGKK